MCARSIQLCLLCCYLELRVTGSESCDYTPSKPLINLSNSTKIDVTRSVTDHCIIVSPHANAALIKSTNRVVEKSDDIVGLTEK